MTILDYAPMIMFSLAVLIFIGAVYDIDWIMELTRADRTFGRKFARISWGVISFFGIIIMIIMAIDTYF